MKKIDKNGFVPSEAFVHFRFCHCLSAVRAHESENKFISFSASHCLLKIFESENKFISFSASHCLLKIFDKSIFFFYVFEIVMFSIIFLKIIIFNNIAHNMA